MTDKKKRVIKLHVSTGYNGADHKDEEELPEGWDDWSESRQNAYLYDSASDYMHNCIEYNAYVEEVEQ